MLTLEDCREFCGLTECQMRAIEYSAHLTHIEALALAQEANRDHKACVKVVRCLHDFSERADARSCLYSTREKDYAIRQYISSHQQLLV